MLARGPLEFAMLHAAGNLKNTFEAATLPHDFRWSAVRGPRALAAPLRAPLASLGRLEIVGGLRVKAKLRFNFQTKIHR